MEDKYPVSLQLDIPPYFESSVTVSFSSRDSQFVFRSLCLGLDGQVCLKSDTGEKPSITKSELFIWAGKHEYKIRQH